VAAVGPKNNAYSLVCLTSQHAWVARLLSDKKQYISRDEGLIGNAPGSSSDAISSLLSVSFILLAYVPYFETFECLKQSL
jgi:hypothetical protein